MTNEELNTALYEKMTAEQDGYRAWLLSQSPEEILKHTYEYTVREDILMSLENNDLSDSQAQALLQSPSPLADVFAEWEDRETDYMDNIWDTVQGRANEVAARREQPGVEMSYEKMKSLFRSAERAGQHLTGYIVFSPESFTKVYSPESRTYAVSSDNKAFQPNKGGYSIYASAIDGSDSMVRLEQYMAAERGGKDGWKVERCYMMADELERARGLVKAEKDRER